MSEWRERHVAHLAKISEEVGFDDAQDLAALIVRFFAAANDRYDEDRDDPVLGPVIKQASSRYGALRRYDFSYANRVAMTEAVRTLLAMPLPAPPAAPQISQYEREGEGNHG